MTKTAYYTFSEKDLNYKKAGISLSQDCFRALEITYTEDCILSLGHFQSMAKENEHSAISDLAFEQILEYLSGRRQTFDIPYQMIGTEFQKSVWKQLCEIPYGQTRTYKEIAEAVKKPAASRAVGMACSKNPLWIVVPCHRVIGSSGKLTGYAGGLAMKQSLLHLEKS